MIDVKVPATTANLGPGFDTLGMGLSFYNEVQVKETASDLEIEIKGEGRTQLPTTKDNLIYQAMKQLFTKVGYKPDGLYIKAINNIPLARGLGSSAAAIVGGLLAANELVEDKLSISELVNLATKIEGHPDNVSPALLGGIVVSNYKNNRVIYEKIAVPELKIVVCIPDYELSTSKSREVLPQQVQFDDAVFNVSHMGLLLTGFLKQDYKIIKEGLKDRLHQPYREKILPGFEKIRTQLESKALGIVLSGSGPTVIALTLEDEEEIGRKMVDFFAEEDVEAKYVVTTPTNQGAQVIMNKK
ncbi:homoserine kinase [Halanaerobacter jeridensis]|uniref:Homoserine kinase n=1 Tax=Halanaerobacter jeridensis TaxID=706427 RepID=A0A939BQ76_9FIRM|nr:homoserine kinase [Halanaerobacter jeridensis]MBM7555999.1 homoserine kinase [Halanaerobacter jeridensis]